MSTLEVNTISPISGTSDVTLGGSSKNIKFASGTTVDFSTNTPTLSGLPDNTPAFHAYLSSDQSISPSTIVKAQLNTEVLDTDNAYDNSTNYRFTCPTAGKYFIYAGLQITQSAYHMYNIGLLLYINGTQYFNTNNITANNVSYRDTVTTTQIIDLAQNDYLELFGYLDYHAGSGYEFEHNKKACYLGGYKIIGA